MKVEKSDLHNTPAEIYKHWGSWCTRFWTISVLYTLVKPPCGVSYCENITGDSLILIPVLNKLGSKWKRTTLLIPFPLIPQYYFLNFLFQCFGGYWNDVAMSSNGWGTHIEHSCNIKVSIKKQNYIFDTTCQVRTWIKEILLETLSQKFEKRYQNFKRDSSQKKDYCWRFSYRVGADQKIQILESLSPCSVLLTLQAFVFVYFCPQQQ